MISTRNHKKKKKKYTRTLYFLISILWLINLLLLSPGRIFPPGSKILFRTFSIIVFVVVYFKVDKMNKKRDRLEVIYDFLRIIQDNHNSIKPTPLLRKSNLSSQSFNDYFEELLSKDFVKEIYDKKKKRYITLSDKGFHYLEKYKTILGFIDDFDL